MSNKLALTSSNSGFYQYLQKINKIPSLTQEEEFLLAKNYLEQNDLKAAGQLVQAHLKLVAKIAISYKNYGLPLQDLVSEGNLGLMQAVKKYDPNLGFRLSTYAMWWIKASIQEYILKSWSLVKIGTTSAQKRLFFSLSKVKNKLANLYSRSVSESDFPELAKELGVSVSEVTMMNSRLAGADISLNNPIFHGGEESTSEMIDFLPDIRPTQEISLINKEDYANKRKLLIEAMGNLNERELQIFTERKLSDPASTLDFLSIKYNISKERVRQIENRAFEKIQNFVLDKSIDSEAKFLSAH